MKDIKATREAGEDLMREALIKGSSLVEDSNDWLVLLIGVMGVVSATIGGVSQQTTREGKDKAAKKAFLNVARLAYEDGFNQAKKMGNN